MKLIQVIKILLAPVKEFLACFSPSCCQGAKLFFFNRWRAL